MMLPIRADKDRPPTHRICPRSNLGERQATMCGFPICPPPAPRGPQLSGKSGASGAASPPGGEADSLGMCQSLLTSGTLGPGPSTDACSTRKSPIAAIGTRVPASHRARDNDTPVTHSGSRPHVPTRDQDVGAHQVPPDLMEFVCWRLH